MGAFRLRGWVSFSLVLSAGFSASDVLAAGGQCEANAGATCQNAINSAANVFNDVFKDKNGNTYDKLPPSAVGKLFQNWPGCPYGPPYQAGWSYGATFQAIAALVDNIDGQWGVPCRYNESVAPGFDANTKCPIVSVDSAETTAGGYLPQYGFVFDLGGPTNQVVIFPWYDHGPNPCESVEYTVYLSDNPYATDKIETPTTTGADPQKWNRAKLDALYLQGKGPTPGATNDWVTVYSLPCGITFRYVSILAGNDGGDFPQCSFLSWDAELDGVIGLTESGEAVCPDKDNDKYVACNCPTAPPVCDCNDDDPAVHPGAPEACDAPDMNCDQKPGACDAGSVCYQSLCVKACTNGEFVCGAGSTCEVTDVGKLCIPQDCTTGGCPAGSTCDPATKTCTPACDLVKCPFGQECQDGLCKDPCLDVKCPGATSCVAGKCLPPCKCFAGDVGCPSPLVCDKGGTDNCVPAACKGQTCTTGQHCNEQGSCVGFCDGVICPAGQKCDEPSGGCVPNCQGVSCGAGQQCDPKTGQCQDEPCAVPCLAPQMCVAGQCVLPEGGTGGSGGAVDGGAGEDGGGSDGGPSAKGGTDEAGDEGNCGCRVAGAGGHAALVALAGAVAALALARRRRTRR